MVLKIGQSYSCRKISLITNSENLMKILRELKNGLNPMRIEEMLQWVSKKNSDHKRCREFMIQ